MEGRTNRILMRRGRPPHLGAPRRAALRVRRETREMVAVRVRRGRETGPRKEGDVLRVCEASMQNVGRVGMPCVRPPPQAAGNK